jgi:hypothetical protein
MPVPADGSFGNPDYAESKLAAVNSRLNRETGSVPVIAPYVAPSAKGIQPVGPSYECKNCGTVNSVDDVYCVACGVRASNGTIREALKRAAKNGEDAAVYAPAEPQYERIPAFGEETGFSTSLNTVEAALKPYINNLTINGGNTFVNAAIENKPQSALPIAEQRPVVEESATEDVPQLSPEEIERQRRAVLAGAEKNINKQVRVKRRIAAFIGLAAALLIVASFFIQDLPYTARHDLNDDQWVIAESSGIDVLVSTFEILHLDDLYETVVRNLNGLGVKTTAAYYKDVVMALDGYTYWQTWAAIAVPVTLLLAFVFAALNLILLLAKAVSGNLKRKVYFVSVLQFVVLAIAAAEILLMNTLDAGVFDFDIGYGLTAAVVLSLAVLAVERFGGRKYPKSERERMKSLYGY